MSNANAEAGSTKLHDALKAAKMAFKNKNNNKGNSTTSAPQSDNNKQVEAIPVDNDKKRKRTDSELNISEQTQKKQKQHTNTDFLDTVLSMSFAPIHKTTTNPTPLNTQTTNTIVDSFQSMSDKLEQLLAKSYASFKRTKKATHRISDPSAYKISDDNLLVENGETTDSSKKTSLVVFDENKVDDAHTVKNLMQKSKVSATSQSLQAAPIRPAKIDKKKEKARKLEAEGWFTPDSENMPEQLKQDLQALKLIRQATSGRKARKDTNTMFQMGTVVDGAADFYSSRLKKKERKSSLAEEILDDKRRMGQFGKMKEEVRARFGSAKSANKKAKANKLAANKAEAKVTIRT